MFKRPITYTDFDGNQVTEDFYFNLTRAEIAEMEVSTEGGYANMLQKIGQSKNGAEIMHLFKSFILNSYGIKSEDGKRFKKSKEISEEFEQSAAYDELFTEMITNADEAIKFVSGIFPFSDDQRKEFLQKAKTTELPSET